jgi:glycosyltransferase involved in cell wall biosynthesis
VGRKILLLITDLEIGGTPTVVRELALRLNDPAKVLIEVACLAPWGPVADDLKAHNIPVHALAVTSVRDLTVILRLISLIRQNAYDTVFSFLIHANAVAAVASLVVRFRLIQSIQTTQPRPRWHWWVQSLVKRRADKIAVPSESAARSAEDRARVDRDQIVVIPNAIDPDAFAPSPIPAENPRPFPIGFIGRLDPIKRIPHLVKSLKQAKELVHLHIFGEGRDRTEIAAVVRLLGLDRVVTLHGAIVRPQDALAQIGLLVLPSAAEGFGLVLIEAMAAGVPVIGTDVPGIRDVVKEGSGVLVPPDDEQQLAAAIDQLVRDAALRHSLTEAAARHVRSNYTWEQILPQYRQLLKIV